MTTCRRDLLNPLVASNGAALKRRGFTTSHCAGIPAAAAAAHRRTTFVFVVLPRRDDACPGCVSGAESREPRDDDRHHSATFLAAHFRLAAYRGRGGSIIFRRAAVVAATR